MGSYTTQTKQCPKCGYVYEKNTARGTWGSEKLYKFGPIFVTCNRCGAFFQDKYVFELAVMDPPAEMTQKFHVSSILIASILGILGLVGMFSDIAYPIGCLFICLLIGAFILWGDYNRYQNNLKKLATEKEASIRRLKKNPGYTALLQAAGYSVPSECLCDSDSTSSGSSDG